MIVVSDGSPDDTPEAAALHDDRVRVLWYDRNLGKGYALRTGSSAARRMGRLDRFGSRPGPRPHRGFLDMARRGDLDVVVGSKRHPDSRGLPRAAARLLAALPAARAGDVLARRPRHPGGDEAVPAGGARRGPPGGAGEALRLRRRDPRRGPALRLRPHRRAPGEPRYRFGDSGVDWRAIAHALWDTGAVFYRLRLLRFYDRRRVLAHRVAVHRREAPGASAW